MGGTTPSKTKEAKNFKLYLKSIQNDKKKYLVARTSSPERLETNYCPRIANAVSAIFPSDNKRVVYNTKWNIYLLQQLSNLKNEDWPAILLNFLKSWDQDPTDLNYQSQISWIDFNNTRSTKLNTSQIKVYNTSIVEIEDRNKASSPNNAVKLKEKDLEAEEENKINEMLDQTALLEENFFAAHSRTSNIQKSFINPKLNLSHSNSGQSFLLQGNQNQDEEEKKDTPTRALDQSATIDLYKGNTFLNHLPVTLSKVTLGLPDPSKASSNMQLIQSIYNYKLVTELIEKHLQSSTNVFYIMISKFTEFYVRKYEKVLEGHQQKTLSNSEVSFNITTAIVDLQQFIRLLYESMNSFYKLDKLKMGEAAKENIFNRDNMLNFITSIVFNERIYSEIFELLRINDMSLEVAFQKNMELCNKKPPEYIGIAPEFCLNERTLEYYFGDVETAFNSLAPTSEEKEQEKIRRRQTTGKDNGPFLLDIVETETDKQQTYLNLNRSSSQNSDSLGGQILAGKEILTRRKTESKLAYAKKLLKDPYITCINVLKKIEKQRSPIYKMKAIVKTAELINTSIQNFYKTFKINNSFKLDADQTLSIFIYIVSRADVKSLTTHIKSIEKFATNNVLNSISGYYATTLEACVNCIVNMEFSEDYSGEDLLTNLKSQT